MATLEDVLDLGKGKVRFEIELRCPRVAFLERVMEMVSQFGVEKDVEITTPHIPLLKHMKKTNEGVRKGVFFDLYPEWKEERLGQQHIIEWMILLDAQVAHMPYSILETEFVEKMQNLNLYVHGANIGNEREMKSAISKGIDQFSTDELELALKVRDTIMNVVT